MTVTEGPTTAEAIPAVPTSAQPVRTILLVAAIVIAGLAGALVGRITGQSTPADNSVDAGFARDMSVHHAQAVEMSMLISDRTSAPDLKVLAYDIALTQQEQIGRMKGWLVAWQLSPTASRPAMAWMGDGKHSGHGASAMALLPDGRMPGIASPADVDRLRGSTGRPAEVLFLQLMVVHHRAGITMAQHAAKNADQNDVRTLAGTMVAGQGADINAMQSMLGDRGAGPA